MVDNVIVGNVCGDPILRQPTRGDRPLARFTVAVNRWRRGEEGPVARPPVFHRVVCFGPLAENVANSLAKGMEVVVVGQWADDSFADERGRRQERTRFEASTVGAGLRWATATVSRTERPAPGPDGPPEIGPTAPESAPGTALTGQEPAVARSG